MSKWDEIKARTLNGTSASASGEKSAEVFIFGDIGESWWGESVTAADFVKEIAALDVDALSVRINSYGGSVSDGLAIYNALRRHKASVTVSVDGVAMSIASLIAMAGDEVEMAENAILMIHAPWGGLRGNAKEMREYADVLDKMAGAMASSYCARSGKSMDDMLALLTDGADHFYTAEEALVEGFCTHVTPALAIAASANKEITQRGFWAARAQAFTPPAPKPAVVETPAAAAAQPSERSEEHTSELQSPAAQIGR